MNAIQKTIGVDQTVATLGLIAYSSINKNKGHTLALKEELTFREVSFHQDTGFLNLKKLLVANEIERVQSSSNNESLDTARKAFKRLSNVIFLGVDVDQQIAPTNKEFAFSEDLETSLDE